MRHPAERWLHIAMADHEGRSAVGRRRVLGCGIAPPGSSLYTPPTHTNAHRGSAMGVVIRLTSGLLDREPRVGTFLGVMKGEDNIVGGDALRRQACGTSFGCAVVLDPDLVVPDTSMYEPRCSSTNTNTSISP